MFGCNCFLLATSTLVVSSLSWTSTSGPTWLALPLCVTTLVHWRNALWLHSLWEPVVAGRGWYCMRVLVIVAERSISYRSVLLWNKTVCCWGLQWSRWSAHNCLYRHNNIIFFDYLCSHATSNWTCVHSSLSVVSLHYRWSASFIIRVIASWSGTVSVVGSCSLTPRSPRQQSHCSTVGRVNRM